MKAVIFDLDYTLLDRDGTIRQFLVQQHGRTCELQEIPHERFLDAFFAVDRLAVHERPVVYQKVGAHLKIELPCDALADDFYKAWDSPLLYEGVDELLTALQQRGTKIGILTNGSVRAQTAKLRGSGLFDRADVCAISGEIGVAKPEPAAFQWVCDQLQVSPVDCCFVGDTPEADIVGAKALGMTTAWRECHLAWPHHVPCAYDHRIAHICELRDVFGLGL